MGWEISFFKMRRNIDDDAPESEGALFEQQGSFDPKKGQVIKQAGHRASDPLFSVLQCGNAELISVYVLLYANTL